MNDDLLIKQISKRLEWSDKHTKFAIEELGDSKSVLDHIGFLEICVKANNPTDRFYNVFSFLCESSKNNEIDFLCELLDFDPCFNSMALFNYKDISNDQHFDLNVDFSLIRYSNFYLLRSNRDKLRDTKGRSFINWYVPDDYFRSYHISKQDTYLGLHTSRWGLKYRILDIFAHHIIADYQLSDIELFEEVFKRKKLSVFNLGIFRMLACNSFTINKKIQDLFIDLFNNNIIKRSEVTQQRYYLYYCLIETLRKKGFGALESIRKVANELGEDKNTIKSRYYAKKGEISRDNVSLSELINKYRFRNTINELTQKITQQS